ncbi:MAG: hypothetical protein AAF394_18660 [Planctomycetota bacterium]
MANYVPSSQLRFSLKLTLIVTTTAVLLVSTTVSTMWADGPESALKTDRESQHPGLWKSFDEMHARYTHNFVESEGFGMGRLFTFEDPHNRMLEIKGEKFAVKELRLIGLGADEPRVYEASWVSMERDKLDRYKKRDLTDFENKSLRRMKAGLNLVWQLDQPKQTTKLVAKQPVQSEHRLEYKANTETQPRKQYKLVGALRAQKSCIACHDAKPNALLGAFVYTMEENEMMATMLESRGKFAALKSAEQSNPKK